VSFPSTTLAKQLRRKKPLHIVVGYSRGGYAWRGGGREVGEVGERGERWVRWERDVTRYDPTDI
jgi:hypothetical protein